MEEVRELAKNLEELVQCPVCFRSLYPSYELCENGHGICSECRKYVNNCPVCRQRFALHQESALLDQLLQCIPMSCPFSNKGCPVVMLDREHHRFCKFRVRKCRILDCKWKGCLKYLKKHVKAFHGDLCYELPSDGKSVFGNYRFEIKTENHSGWSLVTYGSQVFWKYFYRDSAVQHITHQFYHLPKSHRPMNVYYFIVAFKGEDIEFSTTCKAVSSIDSADNVVRNCMTLPNSVLHKFMDPTSENQDAYMYTLRVVQEERGES